MWKSPNLSIKIVMIYLVYLKHIVEYNIIDLMIPSTSTSFSVSISMSIIIPPGHYAISIWKTQYKLFNFVYFFYFLMSSKSKLIAVSEKTYHDLGAMGTLEDSFNSVIERMIQKQKATASGPTLAGTGQNRSNYHTY